MKFIQVIAIKSGKAMIACTLLFQVAFAQNNDRFFRKMPALGVIKLTVGAGASNYMGDLSDGVSLNNIRSHFDLGLHYRLSERIAARAELRYYGIKGTQVGTRNWYNNLSFKADNVDGYVGLQFELFKFSERPKFNPYLFGGVGLTHITPKANYQGVWYSLAPLKTEGVAYSRTPLIFLAGLGVSYQLNNYWNIGIELSDNFAMSDYLDDVSTVYASQDGMSAIAVALADRRAEIGQPLNVAGNVRGNPKVKDSYGFLTFRVEYFLGSRFNRNERNRLKCLKF